MADHGQNVYALLNNWHLQTHRAEVYLQTGQILKN